MENQGVTEIP